MFFFKGNTLSYYKDLENILVFNEYFQYITPRLCHNYLLLYMTFTNIIKWWPSWISTMLRKERGH